MCYILLTLAALLADRFTVFALAQAPAPQLAAIGLLLAVVHAMRQRIARALIAVACSAVFCVMVAPFLGVWTATEIDGSRDADSIKVRIVLVENSGPAMVDYVLAARPDIVAI